jgi:hypothetical protein
VIITGDVTHLPVMNAMYAAHAELVLTCAKLDRPQSEEVRKLDVSGNGVHVENVLRDAIKQTL